MRFVFREIFFVSDTRLGLLIVFKERIDLSLSRTEEENIVVRYETSTPRTSTDRWTRENVCFYFRNREEIINNTFRRHRHGKTGLPKGSFQTRICWTRTRVSPIPTRNCWSISFPMRCPHLCNAFLPRSELSRLSDSASMFEFH